MKREDRRGAVGRAVGRLCATLTAPAYREAVVLSALAVYLAVWTGTRRSPRRRCTCIPT